MHIDEAQQIYRTNYYTEPKIDMLPPLIQPMIFGMAINHGPGTAIKVLQRLLDDSGHTCSADGGVGEETVRCAEAMATAAGFAMIDMLVERRIKLYPTSSPATPVSACS